MDLIKKIFKKIAAKFNQYLTVVIIIGIIIVVNFLSYQIFWRADLTEGKFFSLSSASKKTAANVDDIVNIKAYFSKGLPVKFLNLQREVEDLLLEYANYSGGKIRVKVIDPASLGDAKNELAQKGIPTLRFNLLRNDSFQAIDGYLAVLIQYGDKEAVIPSIGDAQNLEYTITSIIKKLTAKAMPVVGFVSSHGTTNSEQMGQAYAKIKDLYEVLTVDLKKEKKIPEGINTLVIAGPKEKFTEEELKAIDAFLMKGRSLVILADGVRVEQGLGAKKNDLGLEKLLAAWGLKMNNDLVADVSNGRASFSQNRGNYAVSYLTKYPLWPKIMPENLDQENVIVSGLQSVIMPWASSLEIISTSGPKISVLAKTTPDAWSQGESYNVDPQNGDKKTGQGGQYDLAVFVSGKIKSAFGSGETDKAWIVLAGDSDFMTDMFSGAASDNLLFFQNMVDSLALDGDLINIRAKSAVERPIKILEQGPRETIRYVNIFGVTAVVLAFGLWRYFWRRRKGRKNNK